MDRRSYELIVQGRDLPWLLAEWVARAPEKTFLIWAPHEGEHRSWSYAAFDDEARRAAAGLARLGVGKHDRVLIHLENGPELLFVYFACAHLGAVAVLANARASRSDVKHYLDLIEPAGVVTQPEFVEAYTDGGAPPGGFLVVVGEDAAGGTRYDELAAGPPTTGARPREPLLDLRIQFTSGTTSRPKAVLTTHANTLFAAQQTAYAYGLRHEDVCQVFVPLFHNNGLSTLVMSALWAGGSVLLQPKFSASNFWGPAVAYGATWTSLPTTFFVNALDAHPAPEHGFRFWFAGVRPEIEERYGVRTRGHWGMSEMVTLPIVGDPFHEGGRMNIGRPAPGNEIAIRRDDGTDCAAGETGRLYVRGVRGVTMFKEYWRDPEATAASFDADGWFDTGDCVRLGEDGDLYFASRAKDMLRVGGENVASAEIEEIVVGTGWVTECAVVGRAHEMLDEAPVAFVIPSDAAPENLQSAIIEHCARHLADFKRVHDVIVVDQLPRSTLGKVSKQKLRERLA